MKDSVGNIKVFSIHFNLRFGKSGITSNSTRVRRKKSLIALQLPGT
ncbi:hypothetical protein BH10BAC2_BH10BAC2_04240 [soil metagenome]